MNIASKSPVPVRVEEPIPAAFVNRPGIFKPKAFTVSAMNVATGRETVTRDIDASVFAKWSSMHGNSNLREVGDDEADALMAVVDEPAEAPAASAPGDA